MAVIKPVQFPHVERPSVKQNPRPIAAKSIKPANQPRPVQPGNVRPQPGRKINAPDTAKTSREEKLEVAIEVLRQKTAQFYGPQKKEVKQAAALGTFIDIKA